MSPSFLSTAVRPRWLGLLGLVLALATAFAALGSWQLDRSRDEADAPGIVEPVALRDVLQPQEPLTGDAVGRPIEATGEFTGEPLRVEGRRLDGETGAWVLMAFAVPTGTGTATLPVVRGWVPDDARAPEPPAGTVTITGRLESSEAPTGTTGGSVESVSSADLVNRWGSPIYAGFLVMDSAPAGPMRTIPPVTDDGGFALLNLSYALQWWIFAAFAVFIWWRVVRDAHRHELAALVDNGSS
ncbi:MAG TPA: SURF1 family protein [Actinomycetales bacterium]|nr:SURF1 family protein [Actinomycetales bacterium]